MTSIPKASSEAKGTPPSSADPALIWSDPAHSRLWLGAVRSQLLDLVSAAEDATDRYHARVLSRPEARRKIDAAREALTSLLTAAASAVEPRA